MRILPANLGCFLSWPGCCRERGSMPDWAVPGLLCRPARLVYIIQVRLGQLACLSPPIDPSRFTLACLQAPPPPLPLTWLAGPSSSSTTNLASLLLWHLKREVVYCCCNYLWQRVKKNSLTNVFGKDHRVWAGHLGVDRLLKKGLSGLPSCGPAAQNFERTTELWTVCSKSGL